MATTAKKVQPKSDIGLNFRTRLPVARKDRGFTSQAQLAKHITSLGYPMTETTIARIETGERKVSLDEAFVLTAALGCQLAHSVAPTDANAKVRLAPKWTTKAGKLRQWLRGQRGGELYVEDARHYYTGALASREDIAEVFANPPSGYGPSRLPQTMAA